MKRTIYISILAALALTACVSDEPVDRPGITLTAALDGATPSRSEGFSATTLPAAINVTAAFANIDGANYFANVPFTDNNGSYTNTEYVWPTKNLPLKFSAWAAGEGLTVAVNANNANILTLTPAEDIANHGDFIYAPTTADSYVAGQSVNLNFAHKLTRIDVNAINSNPAYTVTVGGFALRNAPHSSATLNTSSGEMTASDNMTTYTRTYEGVADRIVLSSEAQSVLKGSSAFIIPQGNFKDWRPGNASVTDENNGLYLALLINVQTPTGAQIYPQASDEDPFPFAWAAIPLIALAGSDAHNWIAGRHITINLNLSAGLGYVDPAMGMQLNISTPLGDAIPFAEISFPEVNIVGGWTDGGTSEVDYEAPAESGDETGGDESSDNDTEPDNE